jgi:hypothetical protein
VSPDDARAIVALGWKAASTAADMLDDPEQIKSTDADIIAANLAPALPNRTRASPAIRFRAGHGPARA